MLFAFDYRSDADLAPITRKPEKPRPSWEEVEGERNALVCLHISHIISYNVKHEIPLDIPLLPDARARATS